MIRFFQNLYLTRRFYWILGGIALVFIIGSYFYLFITLAQTLLMLYTFLVLIDIAILFHHNTQLSLTCDINAVLSLGNDNKVLISIENKSNLKLKIEVIDELPFELQERNFLLKLSLEPQESQRLEYSFRPIKRGVYNFGKTHIFIQSILGIVQRKITFDTEDGVSVYPSILDMKKYELANFATLKNSLGIKKIRKIGQSQEFEQIKDYIKGDDYKKVNWKATGRSNRLMVNHYTDEKSQRVYAAIDTGRSMKMAFNGLSLVDYAINSALVIANTALQKQDKAGLITFSKELDTLIKAETGGKQLRKILESLYRVEENDWEADYEMLYLLIRKHINLRSLIFLYANFESHYTLKRLLPILRKINKRHLLVLVIFENTELVDYSMQEAKNLEDIYLRTTAGKLANDKYYIINELEKHRIQTIHTTPEKLSIQVINKYIELKSRGMI